MLTLEILPTAPIRHLLQEMLLLLLATARWLQALIAQAMHQVWWPTRVVIPHLLLKMPLPPLATALWHQAQTAPAMLTLEILTTAPIRHLLQETLLLLLATAQQLQALTVQPMAWVLWQMLETPLAIQQLTLPTAVPIVPSLKAETAQQWRRTQPWTEVQCSRSEMTMVWSAIADNCWQASGVGRSL